MIRSAVTISLVEEARGGPFVFWHDLPGACAQASKLGFDGVEIFPPSADVLNTAELSKLLKENGLALAAVGTGAGWVRQKLHLCLPEAKARKQARDFIRAIIDKAGALGAPAIIGSMQGRTGDGVALDAAWGYLTEALQDLGEHARQYGVPLLFEPLNRYETNLVNTIEMGLRQLDRLTTDNVKLLADLFHMNIEEQDIAESVKTGGSRIGHVHFVDSNRRPAGLGHLDHAPIARALSEIGYSGFASAEALPFPDSEAAARQTIACFNRYLKG